MEKSSAKTPEKLTQRREEMAREMERRKEIQRIKSQESRQSTEVNKKIRDENGNETLIEIYSLLYSLDIS